MQYNVLGLMSGSSLDGLDMAYVHFEETAGVWQYEILESACVSYPSEWKQKLASLTNLSARDYLLLHTAYGHWTGKAVNEFLEQKNLMYRVQLIASHGHTAFHMPAAAMTAQLGDGASISAETGIRTITDLRSVDIALGGQGAPIVPIGEKLLFPQYDLYLNIGGIANVSANLFSFIGFDLCPANRILNMLAQGTEKGYDENGMLAARGLVNEDLLNILNSFSYYQMPYPKSLSNEFGIQQIFPIIEAENLSDSDALRTYVEHIVIQISKGVAALRKEFPDKRKLRMLVTGGGAHNLFLISRLNALLAGSDTELVLPDDMLIDFKEALIIALMGALRWREEINVLETVTGASKNSINGAVWC